MAGGAKDYIEVPAGNTGQYAAGGAASGTTVTTTFSKLRLNPADLTVDIGDLTYATSTGSLVHPDQVAVAVSSMPTRPR